MIKHIKLNMTVGINLNRIIWPILIEAMPKNP